jgi:hypothetical protein
MPNQEAWVFCVVGNIEDSGKIVAGRFNKQVGLEPEAMGEWPGCQPSPSCALGMLVREASAEHTECGQ